MSEDREELDEMTFTEFIEMLKDDVRKFEIRTKHNMAEHPDHYPLETGGFDPDKFVTGYADWFEWFESTLSVGAQQ